MGYEITMLVGKPSLSGDEFERDPENPHEDGSGFAYKMDGHGNPIKTGRVQVWFQVMAAVDLCKLGYQGDQLNAIIAKSFDTAKRNDRTVHYFYPPTEGNMRKTEDCYGCSLWPIPVKEVLAAINTLSDEAMGYRRLRWAKALLESMADDTEQLEVMFYGH